MNGAQHTALNLAVITPVFGVGLLYSTSLSLALGAGYMIGTLLITPDLDLRQNDAARRWGALRFLWTPYHLFSRHRGASHTYLLGPLVRVLYLAALLSPLLWLAWGHVHVPGPQAAAALIGYVLSQWIHLMADGIWPRLSVRA